MPARRTPRSIRRLDGVKFAVLLIMSVLAIVLFVAISWQQKQQILPPVVVVTPVPTFTAEAVVAAPVMVSPLTGETVTSGAVQVSGTAAAWRHGAGKLGWPGHRNGDSGRKRRVVAPGAGPHCGRAYARRRHRERAWPNAVGRRANQRHGGIARRAFPLSRQRTFDRKPRGRRGHPDRFRRTRLHRRGIGRR